MTAPNTLFFGLFRPVYLPDWPFRGGLVLEEPKLFLKRQEKNVEQTLFPQPELDTWKYPLRVQ